MICHTPVLFLVFNRPEQTRSVLDRIRVVQPPRLYIHCDGPRTDHPDDAVKVAQVRAILEQEIDWACRVQTLYRDSNFGLRAGVFDALNWFFIAEPQGIILEDDCVPDLSLFPYCETLLEHYATDSQIMHIGCSNLAEFFCKDQHSSYIFSRFSFVWGWASWRRAWQQMSLELEGLSDFEQSKTIENLIDDPLAQAYMLDKFQVTQRHENKSWAYSWFYSILNNNGLCIVPKVNLVQNVGVGMEDATNTTGRNIEARRMAKSLQLPLVHPDKRQPDIFLEQHFFYTSQKTRFRLWLWTWRKKLGL